MIQISPSLINSLESIGRSSKLSEAETQDVLVAARTLLFFERVLTTIAVGYDVETPLVMSCCGGQETA